MKKMTSEHLNALQTEIILRYPEANPTHLLTLPNPYREGEFIESSVEVVTHVRYVKKDGSEVDMCVYYHTDPFRLTRALPLEDFYNNAIETRKKDL